MQVFLYITVKLALVQNEFTYNHRFVFQMKLFETDHYIKLVLTTLFSFYLYKNVTS